MKVQCLAHREDLRTVNSLTEDTDMVLHESVLYVLLFTPILYSVISDIVAKRFKMVQHLIRQETYREVYVYV